MIRIGLLGLDSTHAVDFTRWFNPPETGAAPAARVVAACHGVPTDFPLSVQRREKIAAEVTGPLGIPLAGSPQELAGQVDAIMVLGCDGRRHRADLESVMAAQKPVFVDKPLAADWREGAALLQATQKAHCPCFSASALRFRPELPALGLRAGRGPLRAELFVPNLREPGHPDLSWYGIHAVETIYALFGAGCVTVERRVGADGDVTTAAWPDGSVARLVRTAAPSARNFPVHLASPTGFHSLEGVDYAGLLTAVLRFFQTGRPPVEPREMLEVLAFISAADASRDLAAAPVDLRRFMAGVDL